MPANDYVQEASMIYELVINSRRRPSFVPHDLTYFHTHFICQPLSEGWAIPAAEMLGKSYKAPDFVLWMLRAPIVSLRAKEVLSGVCHGLVEFLSFHAIDRKPYFAVNVLNLDPRKPIFKADPYSVISVNCEFGTVLRDNSLSGVELADPADDIDRRVALGRSANVFAGLVG